MRVDRPRWARQCKELGFASGCVQSWLQAFLYLFLPLWVSELSSRTGMLISLAKLLRGLDFVATAWVA